jgi:hypothetical protein
MAASSTSGPDGPRELSAREKKILAEIEHDLLVADPTLARHLECARWPRTETRPRAVARHRALLITALIMLITAATAVPSGWWGALGVLTAVLLVSWILLFPTDHPNQD